MKRIGALLLAVALLLCGCAGKDEDEKSQDSNDIAIKATKYHLYGKEQTVYCLNLASGESTALLTVEDPADLDNLIVDDSGKRMFFTVSYDLYYWNCNPNSEPVLIDREVDEFQVNQNVDRVLYRTQADLYLYRHDLKESTKLGEANIFSMSPDGKNIIYGIKTNSDYTDISCHFYVIQNGKKAQRIENVATIRASKDHSHIYYTSSDDYMMDRPVYKWDNGKSKKMDFAASNFVVMGNGDVYFNTRQEPGVFYYNGNNVKQVYDKFGWLTKVSEYLCCYPGNETMVIDYKGKAIDAGDGARDGSVPSLYWVDDAGKKVFVFDREEGSEEDNIYSITLSADGTLSKKLVQKNIENNLWYTSVLDENVVSFRGALYVDGKMIVDQMDDWCYERASRALVYAKDGYLHRYQNGENQKLTEVQNIGCVDCTPSGEVVYMCNYDEERNSGDLYLYNADGVTLIAEDVIGSYIPTAWSLTGKRGYSRPEGGSWEHHDSIVRG